MRKSRESAGEFWLQAASRMQRRDASTPACSPVSPLITKTLVGAWVALELVVVAGQRLGLVWWAAADIAFFLVFAWLEGGLLRTCLVSYDGGTATYADTFTSLAQGLHCVCGEEC